MGVHRLRCVPKGPGSTEWRIEAPACTLESLSWDIALGLLLVCVPAACLGGLAWRAALAAGAAAAAALALARSQLAVQYESLTYVRLLGVRLETRRRCGLAGGAAFLPLRSLQAIIIHEDVSSTRADFYLALTLRPNASPVRSRSGSPTGGKGSPGNGAARLSAGGVRRRGLSAALAGSGSATKHLAAEGCEVEVVFPCLRPRLSLLRQVYQQLQPLLQNDLDSLQPGEQQAAQAGEQPLGGSDGAAAAPAAAADEAPGRRDVQQRRAAAAAAAAADGLQ